MTIGRVLISDIAYSCRASLLLLPGADSSVLQCDMILRVCSQLLGNLPLMKEHKYLLFAAIPVWSLSGACLVKPFWWTLITLISRCPVSQHPHYESRCPMTRIRTFHQHELRALGRWMSWRLGMGIGAKVAIWHIIGGGDVVRRLQCFAREDGRAVTKVLLFANALVQPPCPLVHADLQHVELTYFAVWSPLGEIIWFGYLAFRIPKKKNQLLLRGLMPVRQASGANGTVWV